VKSYLPVIFVIFGVVAILKAGRDAYIENTSKHWPTVEGKVLISESSFKSRRETRTLSITEYTYPRVIFEYTVNGMKYSSDYITLRISHKEGHAYPLAHEVTRIVAKYRIGETVTVYYRPNKPQMGVLEPGLTRASVRSLMWVSIVGALSIAVGVEKGHGTKRQNAQTTLSHL